MEIENDQNGILKLKTCNKLEGLLIHKSYAIELIDKF